MTRKIYRTAQGKTVDLGAILLQNENVRAVGNMGVNARGDIVDNQNKSIDSKNRQLKRQYDRQVTPSADPNDNYVAVSRKRSRNEDDKPAKTAKAPVVEAPVVEEEPVDPVVEQSVQPEPTRTILPEGGLAAAIAKARQIKQEPLKTSRQQAQDKPGVRKL